MRLRMVVLRLIHAGDDRLLGFKGFDFGG